MFIFINLITFVVTFYFTCLVRVFTQNTERDTRYIKKTRQRDGC